MQDLNKPLNTVNRSLWEDMRYASDKEVLVKVFFFNVICLHLFGQDEH